jgi:hypothetical protein
MPEPSSPILSTSPRNAAPTFAPRNRLRLKYALRFIQALGAVFVLAFFCAYARTYVRYGTPNTQPPPTLTQLVSQVTTPTHSRLAPRPHVSLPVRHVKRHPQHPSPYHLATLRRIRRFFSRLLDVRS